MRPMTKAVLKKIIKEASKRKVYLIEILDDYGFKYNDYTRACAEHGIEKASLPPGRMATTYSKEKVMQVKRRLSNGEFLKDICEDMGMDPRNFARYCRVNGFTYFTKKSREQNYKKRAELKPRTYKTKETSLVQKIKGLLSMGHSNAQIAKKAKCSSAYVGVVRKRK